MTGTLIILLFAILACGTFIFLACSGASYHTYFGVLFIIVSLMIILILVVGFIPGAFEPAKEEIKETYKLITVEDNKYYALDDDKVVVKIEDNKGESSFKFYDLDVANITETDGEASITVKTEINSDTFLNNLSFDTKAEEYKEPVIKEVEICIPKM